MESNPKGLEADSPAGASRADGRIGVPEPPPSARRQPVPILDLPRDPPADSPGTRTEPERAKEDLNEHLKGLQKGHEDDFRASSLARRLLRHSRGGRALDAGCGTGILSLELLRRGREVLAVDHEEEQVALTRATFAKHGYDAETRALSLEHLDRLGKGRFDEAFCCDVVEHVEDDDLALAQLHSILAPGGRLILTVPAWPFLFGERDERMGHYRRYSRRALRALFKRSDFKLEDMRWWNLSGFLLNAIGMKLLRFKPSESFRYQRDSRGSRMRNRLLNGWFHGFENNIPVPVGLTLIVVARKADK